MIQRVQTIYIFISIIIVGMLYFWFPVLQTSEGGIFISQNDPFYLILMGLSILLGITAIFSFKDRKRQFVLNRLNILINFVLLGVFVYWSLKVPGEALVSEKGIGIIFPIFSIVFLVLANKAIKKDEDLVKSVDRLR